MARKTHRRGLGWEHEDVRLKPLTKERAWLKQAIAAAAPASCNLKVLAETVKGRHHMVVVRRNKTKIAIGRAGGYDETQAFRLKPDGQPDFSREGTVAETGGRDREAVEWVVQGICERHDLGRRRQRR